MTTERYEYGVAYTGKDGRDYVEWIVPTGDVDLDLETLEIAVRRWHKCGQDAPVVRRRVGELEFAPEGGWLGENYPPRLRASGAGN